MCGLPFSGKTTRAKQLGQEGYEIVAFDWLWHARFPDENPDLDKVEKITLIRNSAKEKIASLLKSGRSVVYDDMNSRFDQRQELKQLAVSYGVVARVEYLDVSTDEVRRRRKVNHNEQTRHDVAQVNFDRAIAEFEKPSEDE